MLVQAAIPEAGIDAFHKPILRWFAGCMKQSLTPVVGDQKNMALLVSSGHTGGEGEPLVTV
jgi:hypothetical protein